MTFVVIEKKDEILTLQKDPLGIRELEKVKDLIEADFLFAQDSIFSQALLIGQYEIASRWRSIDDYILSIQKVSPEDIPRVANKYLNEDNRTVGILVPLQKKRRQV